MVWSVWVANVCVAHTGFGWRKMGWRLLSNSWRCKCKCLNNNNSMIKSMKSLSVASPTCERALCGCEDRKVKSPLQCLVSGDHQGINTCLRSIHHPDLQGAVLWHQGFILGQSQGMNLHETFGQILQLTFTIATISFLLNEQQWMNGTYRDVVVDLLSTTCRRPEDPDVLHIEQWHCPQHTLPECCSYHMSLQRLNGMKDRQS